LLAVKPIRRLGWQISETGVVSAVSVALGQSLQLENGATGVGPA
jgi:hypothetical protein